MTSKKNKARAARESSRKFKKKANPLNADKVGYIDYKDVSLLQRFMSDRSKIRGQRMSGVDVQQQRDLATAIKNAREMALLPYTKRVASTRAPRAGGDRREGREGREGREDADVLESIDAQSGADISADLPEDVTIESAADSGEES